MRHIHRLSSAVAFASFLALTAATPVHAANDENVEKRVSRLEKEIRAVQRKVFPGGTPVEPDIQAPASAAPGLPSSTPVSDLIVRVTALETQLATLTGQVEQNSYKLRQIEQQLDTLRAAPAPAVGETASAGSPSSPASGGAPNAAPTGASETRKAAVAAVERPDTGDAAQDSYVYGFRLWDAKFYPEAQEQLKTTVEKYGNTPVGSRAQNLLGRAYLDDGKPALASVNFYENYQKRPEGERAAQSLTYLGEALIQLKKPKDACKVYGELEDRYGASLSSAERDMMAKGRARAKCGV